MHGTHIVVSYKCTVMSYLGMKPTNKEDIDPFEAIIEEVKEAKGVSLDNELEVEDLKELVVRFKAAVKAQTGQDFPTSAYEQLWGAICAVFRSLDERTCYSLPQDGRYSCRMGYCCQPYRPWCSVIWVILQLPVYASLVMPVTGEDLFNGEYLINAQGEDVVAGIRTPQQITKIGSQRWADRAGYFRRRTR